MNMLINNTQLELVQGDITTQKVDAIVNAANKALAGGGGVDGAIHRAGGPRIAEECRALRGCPEGQARITSGGNLAAKYVIHTVGPIYNQGGFGQEKVLASAYRNSLELAREYSLTSIAFPSISTGAFRYPLRDAANIALETVIEFLQNETHHLQCVRFVLFDAKTFAMYESVLQSRKDHL